MKVSKSVRAYVEKTFEPGSVGEVIRALETAQLPGLSGSSERVLLGILILAKGNWYRFQRELGEAGKDWRDTLCAAGLENENWRDVLRDKAIPFEEED